MTPRENGGKLPPPMDFLHARKRKTKIPCERCRMNPELCFCELIPRIETRTKISLLIHARELKRTTNTGSLALVALTNSSLHVRGLKRSPLDGSKILDRDYQPLLFFPSDDAVELTESYVSRFEKPIQLIVPDGNWRQASKVHTRYPEFDGIPRVKMTIVSTATRVMRKESKPSGMATLEAIAAAMAILENHDVGEKLKSLYEVKLLRTLKGRGEL